MLYRYAATNLAVAVSLYVLFAVVGYCILVQVPATTTAALMVENAYQSALRGTGASATTSFLEYSAKTVSTK